MLDRMQVSRREALTLGLGAGAAMLLLASGALLPAHSYKVSIDFTDRVITPDAGFGTATAFVAFEQSTEFDFQTLLADGGTPGAGEDAGSGDAGSTTDAGSSADAGPSDAGSTTDAGSGDAGSTTDAGSGDAGSPADAGSGDAGSHSDAGTEQDAGIGQSHSNDSGGCGCSSVSRSTGSFSNLVFCGALVAWLWRRRRAHR